MNLKRSIISYLCPLSVVLYFVLACSNDNTSTPIPEQEEEEQPVIDPENKLIHFDIDTQGSTIVDEPKVPALMTISKNEQVFYDGHIGIEIRGASSQSFAKKSYGFETWDENNEDLNVSLLGLPEEEDWILHGPYSDKSLMRNLLIYDLARDLGQYASRSQFVELTINGGYHGVYVFMEKLKRDSGRIDINNLKEDENSGDDLTGGYILKIDKMGVTFPPDYNDQNSFESSYAPPMASMGQKINFLFEDPDEDDITPEQRNYITNYISDFEDALAGDDFADPDLGYAAYIDVDSFIDFFLLNEVSNNVDGYRLSTFMHKDKNGKLKMGPIWDFNLAFGNADYCSGGEVDVWAYKFNERCSGDFWLVPFWWDRLLQDPAFVTQLKERWNTLRGGVFSENSIKAKITSNVSDLQKAGAIETNFDTWKVLGTYLWPNKFVGQTFSDEIGYLESFIENRLIWLDGAISAL